MVIYPVDQIGLVARFLMQSEVVLDVRQFMHERFTY